MVAYPWQGHFDVYIPVVSIQGHFDVYIPVVSIQGHCDVYIPVVSIQGHCDVYIPAVSRTRSLWSAYRWYPGQGHRVVYIPVVSRTRLPWCLHTVGIHCDVYIPVVSRTRLPWCLHTVGIQDEVSETRVDDAISVFPPELIVGLLIIAVVSNDLGARVCMALVDIQNAAVHFAYDIEALGWPDRGETE